MEQSSYDARPEDHGLRGKQSTISRGGARTLGGRSYALRASEITPRGDQELVDFAAQNVGFLPQFS